MPGTSYKPMRLKRPALYWMVWLAVRKKARRENASHWRSDKLHCHVDIPLRSFNAAKYTRKFVLLAWSLRGTRELSICRGWLMSSHSRRSNFLFSLFECISATKTLSIIVGSCLRPCFTPDLANVWHCQRLPTIDVVPETP